MTVYAVRDWQEKFETSESRKYKRCSWFAERNDFSTGWYAGLEEFGPEKWAPIFGTFEVLCKIASRAKVRGVFAGEKGEPYSLNRLTLEAGGLTREQIETAWNWSIKTGWIVPVEQSEQTTGRSPGDHRENSSSTEPNGTGHYITGPDRTGHEAATEPSRSDVLKIPETQQRKKAAMTSWGERIDASPLLQQLKIIPVPKSTKDGWHGGVFSNLKPFHIGEADNAFWLDWYARQSNCPQPELLRMNAAEAVLMLAAKFTAARMADADVKRNRLAVWISMIRARESCRIRDDDIDRAAAAVCEWLQVPRPELREASRVFEAPPPKPATGSAELNPKRKADPRRAIEQAAALMKVKHPQPNQ